MLLGKVTVASPPFIVNTLDFIVPPLLYSDVAEILVLPLTVNFTSVSVGG